MTRQAAGQAQTAAGSNTRRGCATSHATCLAINPSGRLAESGRTRTVVGRRSGSRRVCNTPARRHGTSLSPSRRSAAGWFTCSAGPHQGRPPARRPGGPPEPWPRWRHRSDSDVKVVGDAGGRQTHRLKRTMAAHRAAGGQVAQAKVGSGGVHLTPRCSRQSVAHGVRCWSCSTHTAPIPCRPAPAPSALVPVARPVEGFSPLVPRGLPQQPSLVNIICP
jgi:hypothetical protein